MKTPTPCSTDITTLVNIENIIIDTSLPVEEKKRSYIKQIGNPHCFRFEDMTIHVSFINSGPSFEDRIKQLLLSGQGLDLTTP